MDPSLLLAVAVFTCFLAVLALLAFAGYRTAAKREGPGLSTAGGCALAVVLLGAGFFALIGFLVFVGVAFFHDNKDEIREHLRRLERGDRIEFEHEFPADSDAEGEHGESHEEPAAKDDGVRQY